MKRLQTLLILALTASCLPRYTPPTSDRPHAIVKIRRSYDSVAGTTLRELVTIERHEALVRRGMVELARTARIDSLLVHPKPALLGISSDFSHQEMRLVQESYTVYESRMESESYDCSTGFGANRVYRRCTRMVSRSHPVTKQRWVNKTVDVSDGSCAAALSFSPRDGHVYLVQYTYRAHGVCEAACYEQVGGAGGRFRNQPCPQ